MDAVAKIELYLKIPGKILSRVGEVKLEKLFVLGLATDRNHHLFSRVDFFSNLRVKVLVNVRKTQFEKGFVKILRGHLPFYWILPTASSFAVSVLQLKPPFAAIALPSVLADLASFHLASAPENYSLQIDSSNYQIRFFVDNSA